MPDPAHKQIGDYEIVRELGHGGMGQVYLVRNLISDRIEAMKVLLPDLLQQGDLANRFLREIKVLASLEHPNIAQLRTAFTAENQLVMIMEYVEGDTLAERLHAGVFSPQDALNYSSQVLVALSYAHGKGVIHRDIKPANMMLTPQGVVKLMDFGIARSSQDLGMTATGTTLGSLDYMSPEQVKSEPTDARSDLYSVGVSLYEMVTGHRMFSATSSFSVMEAHIKEMPRPPIELVPTLPKALSDIIMMAVAKDPAHRFQTADAMRNALSQVATAAFGAAASPLAATTPAQRPMPQPRAVSVPPQVPTIAATIPAQPSMQQPVSFPPPPVPSAVAPPPQSWQPVSGPGSASRGGRHLGWIIVAAIVILVALFGGTEVYRSRKPIAVVAPGGTENSTVPGNELKPQSNTKQPGVEPLAQPPSPISQNTPPPMTTPTPQLMPQPHKPVNVPPPPAPPAGPTPAEIAAQKKLLDDLESEMDHLDSRAAAVESSLDALEQQQHQSGFGLRGDMVATRASMRTDMARAKDALQGADPDRARKYLDMANHEIEKLEAFLGRR